MSAETNQDATLGMPSIAATASAPATPAAPAVKGAAVTAAPATPTTSTDTPATTTIKVRERREVIQYPAYIDTPLVQTRVVERPAGTPLADGDVEVSNDTPVSGWANEGGV